MIIEAAERERESVREGERERRRERKRKIGREGERERERERVWESEERNEGSRRGKGASRKGKTQYKEPRTSVPRMGSSAMAAVYYSDYQHAEYSISKDRRLLLGPNIYRLKTPGVSLCTSAASLMTPE